MKFNNTFITFIRIFYLHIYIFVIDFEVIDDLIIWTNSKYFYYVNLG